MKKIVLAALTGLLLTFATTGAYATTYDLSNFFVNKIVNGGSPDLSDTPSFSGLGTFNLSYSGAGNYNVVSFFDYDINILPPPNASGFMNQYGYATGSPSSDGNQSWEVNELYTLAGDVISGTLSNSTALPIANSTDDAAMALGYSFDLTSTQTAYLSFTASDIAPLSGFFLTQTDAYTGDSLFLTSTFNVRDAGTNNPVPEPSTFLLFGSAVAGLALYRKKVRKSA